MTRTDTAVIHLPSMLRPAAGGATRLPCSAATVRGALAEIERDHPALWRSVCDDAGAVRRHLNLFVNSDHVRDRQGLETPLVPGDVLTILPAVSGG